jgi:hypothetical protein
MGIVDMFGKALTKEEEAAEIAEINQYLSMCSPKVKKNVRIISFNESNQQLLFHISEDSKIKAFNPRISRKTMLDEDRTLPRVSTSPFITGCMAGYGTMEDNYNSVRNKKDFRGGWYIYTVPYDFGLQPSEVLQPDVRGTDEVWLVPYNTKQWKIVPVLIGSIFIHQLITYWEKKYRIVKAEFYLHNSSKTPIVLARNVIVEQGYYSFKVEKFNDDFHDLKRYTPPVVEDLKSITSSEYLEHKKLNADMLSHGLESHVTNYRPISYTDRIGFFEIPGFSKYAANAEGEILNKRLGNSTIGGVAGSYRRVSAYPDHSTQARLCYAHDLVCRAFYGPPPPNSVVMHRDNNKLNTAASNLSWGTQSQNITDMWRDGLRDKKVKAEAYKSFGW